MPNGPSVYGIQTAGTPAQAPDWRAIGQPLNFNPLNLNIHTTLMQMDTQRRNAQTNERMLGLREKDLEYRMLNDQRKYEFDLFKEITNNAPRPFTVGSDGTVAIDNKDSAFSTGPLDGTNLQQGIAAQRAELQKEFQGRGSTFLSDLEGQGVGAKANLSDLIKMRGEFQDKAARNPAFARYDVLNKTLANALADFKKAKSEEGKGEVIANHEAMKAVMNKVADLSQLNPEDLDDELVNQTITEINQLQTTLRVEDFNAFVDGLDEVVKEQITTQKRLGAERDGLVAIEERQIQPTQEEMVELYHASIMNHPTWSQVAVSMYGENASDAIRNIVTTKVATSMVSDQAQEWNAQSFVRNNKTQHKRESTSSFQGDYNSNKQTQIQGRAKELYDKDPAAQSMYEHGLGKGFDDYEVNGLIQQAKAIKKSFEGFDAPQGDDERGFNKKMSEMQIFDLLLKEKIRQDNPKYEGDAISGLNYDTRPKGARMDGVDAALISEVGRGIQGFNESMQHIASAESGFEPWALVGDINGALSGGLFQFNGQGLSDYLGAYIESGNINDKEFAQRAKEVVEVVDGRYRFKKGAKLKDIQNLMVGLTVDNPNAFVQTQYDWAYENYVDPNIDKLNMYASRVPGSNGVLHDKPGFSLLLESMSINSSRDGVDKIINSWGQSLDGIETTEEALYKLHLSRLEYVKPHIIRQAGQQAMNSAKAAIARERGVGTDEISANDLSLAQQKADQYANQFWQTMYKRYQSDYALAAGLLKADPGFRKPYGSQGTGAATPQQSDQTTTETPAEEATAPAEDLSTDLPMPGNNTGGTTSTPKIDNDPESLFNQIMGQSTLQPSSPEEFGMLDDASSDAPISAPTLGNTRQGQRIGIDPSDQSAFAAGSGVQNTVPSTQDNPFQASQETGFGNQPNAIQPNPRLQADSTRIPVPASNDEGLLDDLVEGIGNVFESEQIIGIVGSDGEYAVQKNEDGTYTVFPPNNANAITLADDEALKQFVAGISE